MTLLLPAALALGVLLRLLLLREAPSVPLKAPWAFFLAFGAEALSALLALSGILPGERLGRWGQGLNYSLLFLGFALNLHLPGMRLAGLGAVLNAAVIFANGGHMPVDPVALERAGLGALSPLLERAGDGVHVLAGEGSRLLFLGDWIVLAGRVVSPGDLLILLGAFMLGLGPLKRASGGSSSGA